MLVYRQDKTVRHNGIEILTVDKVGEILTLLILMLVLSFYGTDPFVHVSKYGKELSVTVSLIRDL